MTVGAVVVAAVGCFAGEGSLPNCGEQVGSAKRVITS